MTVVSLLGCQPLARFDGLSWTQAQILEGQTSAGPFSVIDTQDIDPGDDARNPRSIDLTTTKAVLGSGWYPVVLLDEDGNTQMLPARPFPPPQSTGRAALITVERLRREIGRTRTDDDDRLRSIAVGVTMVVERLTGKRFTPTPALPSDPAVSITIPVFPSGAAPLARARSAEIAVTIPHASEIDTVSVNGSSTMLGSAQYLTELDSTLADPYVRRIILTDPALAPVSSLTVTGRFGITPPPEDLVDAAAAMGARRAREKDASWGDSVQTQEGGLISYYRSLSPWVRMVIDSYCEVGV